MFSFLIAPLLIAVDDVTAFLNQEQSYAYEVEICHNDTRRFKGVFYWHKGGDRTACAFIYPQTFSHTSIIERAGEKTYAYNIPKNARNKVSITNITKTPFHAFFAYKVDLNSNPWYKARIHTFSDQSIVLTIHHFSDCEIRKFAKTILRKSKCQMS